MKTIVFGEIFYHEETPGLPRRNSHINFALHAAKLGAEVSLISAFDASERADAVLSNLCEHEINTAHVARIAQTTSTDDGTPPILPWQNIPLPRRLPEADVVYVSSLPLFSEISKNTLVRLLDLGQYPFVVADCAAVSEPVDSPFFAPLLKKASCLHFSSDNPSLKNRTSEDLFYCLRDLYPNLAYIHLTDREGNCYLFDTATATPHHYTLVPNDQISPEDLQSATFSGLLCALSQNVSPEEALKHLPALVEHLKTEGDTAPYPLSVSRNLLPAATASAKTKKSGKKGVFLSVLAIVVSLPFVIYAFVASYFLASLHSGEDDTVPPDDQGQSGQQNPDEDVGDGGEDEPTGNFPPLSERPLYTGESLLVPTPEEAANAETLLPADMIEATLPSVVCVQTDMGEGTGFILTSDGYIVTNYHIISDGSQFTVILSDDTLYDAAYVGGDELTDLAVLKIDAGDKTLTPVKLGNSDTLRAGDSVIAIGSPGGSEFAGTATAGMVSATKRRLTTDSLSGDGSRTLWVIQTDTAVNFGNSGGPLLNMQGQVIGINTLKYAELYFEGISFSLPINGVMDIVNILMKEGSVTTYPADCFAKHNIPLGITVSAMTKEELKAKNLDHGIFVESVVSGSNADRDGVKKGDIILSINGADAKNVVQVRNAIFDHREGDRIELKIYRDKKVLDIAVTLRP